MKITESDFKEVMDKLATIHGGYVYYGACSFQVCFPLKSGKSLRFCIMDDDCVEPGEPTFGIDLYGEELPPCITGHSIQTGGLCDLTQDLWTLLYSHYDSKPSIHRGLRDNGDGKWITYYRPVASFIDLNGHDVIKAERRRAALTVEYFSRLQKQFGREDASFARLMRECASSEQRVVKACTWILGWLGEGTYVETKQWNEELWSVLDYLISLIYV